MKRTRPVTPSTEAEDVYPTEPLAQRRRRSRTRSAARRTGTCGT